MSPDVCGVVLLRNDGAALMQLRDDKPEIMDPGLWVFPGGHQEQGESSLAAARREFHEETTCACAELMPLVVFPAKSVGYTGDFQISFFWTHFEEGQSFVCLEGQELRFVSRKEIEALPRPAYVTDVWDKALEASGILRTKLRP